MKINLLLTIAAAATLLTACNKDNEPETPWNGEIRLTTATASMDVQSRATQDLQLTQFAANEKVSVFIGEENAGKSTTYTQPLEFTANGTGGLTTALDSQPYFPQSGKGVNIYACYPQGAATDTTKAQDFTILADQSIDANYNKSDLMLGLPAKNPVTRTSDAVALTFTHQLSKINIELVAGAGVPNLDGAVVKLKSIVPTISFNPKTGIGTNTATGTAADVTVMKAATASLKGSAIIIPQTIPTTQAFIEVTLKSGGILTHNLAMATAFASKSVYTYTITVKLTGLSVKSTITDWTSIGNAVTGDATM